MDIDLGYITLSVVLHCLGISLLILLASFARIYSAKCFVQIRMGLKSRRWIKTDGTIAHVNAIDDSNKRQGLSYSYNVAGVTYFNTKISCDENFFSTSRLEKIKLTLKTYACERRVLVYYDPNYPANATLKTGIDHGAAVGNLMVICLALIIVVLLLSHSCLWSSN